jgi:hypothetical protein
LLRLGELGVGGEQETGARDAHRESAAAQERGSEKGGHPADDRTALGETHRGADDELLAIGVDEGDLDEALLHHTPQAERVADAAPVRVDGHRMDA